MVMDKNALRARLMVNNAGLTAAGRLRRQLDIIDRRIKHTLSLTAPTTISTAALREAADALQLDAETFYTVAFDLLKLIDVMLDNPALSREPTYKAICAVRNHLVRHAYDKADGDPYNGFGFGDLHGVELKAGTSRDMPFAPRYYPDRDALANLLERYPIITTALLDGHREPPKGATALDSGVNSGQSSTPEPAK